MRSEASRERDSNCDADIVRCGLLSRERGMKDDMTLFLAMIAVSSHSHYFINILSFLKHTHERAKSNISMRYKTANLS